jgi:minor extracellular serine protease Vpr
VRHSLSKRPPATFRRPTTRLMGIAACVAALPGLVLTMSPAAAEPVSASRPVPIPEALKAEGLAKGSLAPSLRKAVGTVTVSVAMSEKPIAATVPDGATSSGSLPSRSAQRSQTSDVVSQQDQMITQARKLGARSLGRASKAANVVAMTIPAKNLDELAKLSGVVSVKPVARYEMHADPGGSGSLAQAADYIKATQVRRAGFDGSGVRVAILDSGIDFTHEYLGGPGTVAAYEQCYKGATGTAYNKAPVGECAALFGPNAPKVKGGIDFVGETWPNTPNETTDPNPIDFGGHGTHVADIVGGRSKDGTHTGIAPGVDLYAVKVCSAVATSCSGVALIQAVDWALDPDGNGDIEDAVDIVNLSLGSGYGQEQDDLTAAINNMVRAGVIAVASAGNNADRPFIVGSPSAAARAISVAQTALPDDKLYSIKVNSPTIAGLPDNTIRNSKLQSWSVAPTRQITAPLAEPRDANHLGCFAADFVGFPAGAVALIKRGGCAASIKAQYAQAAGASAVIIWNNVPGDPPDFSFGGGADVTIPVFTISMANGMLLSSAVKAGTVSVTLDPSATTALTNTTVGTSSRGLTVSGKRAKPDIGAPGAWLSAEVGTGNGQTNFGGTSGAAPVVTGAAALLVDKFANARPAIIKSRLLNNASTANRTPDAEANLYRTPISRIGAGEVRVAPAANAQAVLRNTQRGSGNIGLGLPHLTETTTYAVPLRLINTSSRAKPYLISSEFRDPADRRTGAVTLRSPAVVRVPAKSARTFTVRFTIDPSKLAEWPFTHAAGYTGDGSELNGPEFDGWIKAISTTERLHLGWTVLPHRSADVSASVTTKNRRSTLTLTNESTVLDGGVSAFGLTGTSPKLAAPAPGEPGTPGSNVAVIDLAATGVRDDVNTAILQFAIAGQQRQTVPLYPAGYEVDIDTNRDGEVDFAVFQSEAIGFGSSGQSLVTVYNVATETSAAYFYTDADFDSATQVLSVPFAALGLTRGSTFDFSVLAYDNYFSGEVTDEIAGQSWTVGAAKYRLTGGADTLVVPAGEEIRVGVVNSAKPVASSETGLLLLFDDAATRDFQAVTIAETPRS